MAHDCAPSPRRAYDHVLEMVQGEAQSNTQQLHQGQNSLKFLPPNRGQGKGWAGERATAKLTSK